MPIYNYVAKNLSGQVIKGSYEAENSNAVYTFLKQKGYFPVQISLQKTANQQTSKSFSFLNKVKIKDLAVFTRQFATILKAGVPMVRCLDILRKQTENKKLAQVLDRIYEDVQKGVMLSEAMKVHKDVFSSLFINMIEAGEISGTLDNSLEKMAIQFEKEFKLNQKVKGALTYPIIMMCICVLAVIVLLGFVIPQFEQIFKGFGMKLPLLTQVLLNIGNFIKNYWYIVIICLIGTVWGIVYFKSTPLGKRFFDELFLKIRIPRLFELSNLVKKVLAARFTRVSATMLGAGVSLIKTLEIAEKVVDNVVVQQAMVKIKEVVTTGGSLAEEINKAGIFPVMVAHMIGIGEESGTLDKMLEKAADFCEEEVDTAITQFTTLLEPLILIVMAGIIGTILLAVIIPMFSIAGGIK